MTTLDLQIAAGTDDCHVNADGSGFNSDGTKVVWHSGSSLGVVHFGLRFLIPSDADPDNELPPGSVITVAYLTFDVSSSTEDDPYGSIYFVKEANPAAFNGTTRRPRPEDLTLTTASTPMSAFGVGAGAVNSDSLVAAAQEACDLRSAGEGSLAVVGVSASAGSPSARDMRFTAYDDVPLSSAILHLEYDAPSTDAIPFVVREQFRPRS